MRRRLDRFKGSASGVPKSHKKALSMSLPVLPQTSTLGSLDPHTLVLELPTTNKAGLEISLAGRDDGGIARIHAHELRHFDDLVGTVWGQDYLDLLFRAYDAMLHCSTAELAYPELLRLFDADRAILFPSYYKYVMQGAPAGSVGDRWSMSFSTGARIRSDGAADETDPILFVRFNKGKVHVARQPLTVGSLLELRAVGAEMGPLARSLARLPAAEAIVEERLRSRELLSAIYDPQLTTYSVGAHVAAKALGQEDLAAMLDAGFKVAGLALNLTGNFFGRLQPAEGFVGEMGRQRQRAFGVRRDRGYAYATLLFHMRGLAGDLVGEQAIAATLTRAALRPVDELYAGARRHVDAQRKPDLIDARLREMRERLAEVGLAKLARPDLDRTALTVPALSTPGPMVMTGEDLAEFYVGEPGLDAAQTGFLVDCHSRLRTETRQALRAGRGMDFNGSDFIY